MTEKPLHEKKISEVNPIMPQHEANYNVSLVVLVALKQWAIAVIKYNRQFCDSAGKICSEHQYLEEFLIEKLKITKAELK